MKKIIHLNHLFLIAFIINFYIVYPVEIWNIWETSVVGPSSGNAFKINVSITVKSPYKIETTLDGFYDGNGIYKFRFMPNTLGSWSYMTNSNNPFIENKTGSFQVTNATGNNRGPVYCVNNVNSSVERPYFRYADGGIFFECGTTTYGWIELQTQYTQETVNNLKYCVTNNIFNKVRMMVFPYWQGYTHIQPISFPFTGNKHNNFNNFTSFNLTFWSLLDSHLNALQTIGIIIDLIVFHPYDYGQWGFDCMGGQNVSTYNVSTDLFYLKYLIARVSAYRNIWWSIANEYDRIVCKRTDIPNSFKIWDIYFEYFMSHDPYNKEKSIHQYQIMYNYSREWVTHFSVQGYQNVDYKYYFNKFNVRKAIILDEVQYEGNISKFWGNLTGLQESSRFWEGTSMGVQVGHSEAYLPNKTNNQSGSSIMWYNYGNKLRGSAYLKIKWYYEFMTNYSMHPPFHKLFTFCYVKSVYNSWTSNNSNVTGCYVSQLYDKINYSYYLIRWTDPFNTNSKYEQNYNTRINIKLHAGVYKMYKIDEWNEKIVLLNGYILINDDEGYTYSAQTLPQTIQFINQNSAY
eukprot:127391_1